MPETLPGNPVPRSFIVDRKVMAALDSAALSSRVQYGPRSTARGVIFRASELGNVVRALDADGGPAGCPRKVFYSFHPRYDSSPIDAATAHNFARGDLEETHAEKLLTEAGLLVDRHVKLGAWDPKNPDPKWRADPRYPDRSRGLVRGDIDFVIQHPDHPGVDIPLDWKSTSSYSFDPLFVVGGKPENVAQVIWCAYEMRSPYFAIGYVNKEDGRLCVLLYETDVAWVESTLLPACETLRSQILRDEIPARPEGTRPASGLYDRVWPCYVYSPKKNKVTACGFYSACHGEAPPRAPIGGIKKKKIPRKPAASVPSSGDLHFS